MKYFHILILLCCLSFNNLFAQQVIHTTLLVECMYGEENFLQATLYT